MNGDRTAEQWAEAASEAAQRSAKRAEAAKTLAEKMYETAEQTARDVDEVKRMVRKLESTIVVGLTTLREQIKQRPGVTHTSITEEDWEDSPTGTRKMVSKSVFNKWKREAEMSDDAKKWRGAIKTSGKVALIVVGVLASAIVGGLIRHYLFGGH
jgi:flavin-dependent dehydrogenase